MKHYSHNRAYLELHFSVLLWGVTGILGRLITLNSSVLVWYRLVFTCISLLCLKQLYVQLKSLSKGVIYQLIFIGSIASLHWVTFYGVIHMANVSIAVGCMATTSLFASFLEPFMNKKTISNLEVMIGAFVTFGLGIMFFYGQQYSTAIFVGLFSAALAATFTILNKIVVDKHSPEPIAMTFIELGGGALFLTLFIPIYKNFVPIERFLFTQQDLIWLLLLAIVCTTLPFILSLRALKRLSAFESVLAINLEPIYAILLAVLIFQENEELDWRFYVGTGIVIASVFLYPLLKKKPNSL